MSKYIIDIPNGVEWIIVTCRTKVGFLTRDFDFDSLEELNSDYINEHYGDLQDDAYQRGLNDAWEAARKIALMDTETSENVTGYFGLFRIMENLTPTQAIEKLKAYEEKQSDKIKRGDIVNVKGCCNDGLLGVVTKVFDDNCYIMWGDGSGGAWSKDSVVKTGKHIDIDKILEELRYDS